MGNSLVDMYPKCGSIEFAWRVFNKDAILECGYLDHHDIWTLHEMGARTQSTRAILTMQQVGVVSLMVASLVSLWAIAWLTCM